VPGSDAYLSDAAMRILASRVSPEGMHGFRRSRALKGNKKRRLPERDGAVDERT
jgi:hypothetical protein